VTTLALVYAALAVLSTWLIIGSRGDWRIKAVVIVVAPVYAFLLWQEVQPRTGWPTYSRPVSSSVFDWGLIREPSAGDRGEIDLWLTPPGAIEPRAYRLPYTRALHKQVQAALDATKHGTQLQAKHSGNHRGASSKLRSPWVFYPSPPVKQPPKPR
jgi:hypothetical protein